MTCRKLAVGDRIWSADEIGTIRYIGIVNSSKGDYLGVEWDNAARGKHDGSHNGKRYFQTIDNAASGSFIKEKLLDQSRTCLQALNEKYGRIDDASAGVDEDDAYLHQDNGRVIKVEVVGMRKLNDLQCEFDKLETVDFFRLGVYDEPDPQELGNQLKSVQELDLSYNLIRDWLTVSRIVTHLHRLRSLDLRGNRLNMNPDHREECKRNLQKLSKLNLSCCNCNWEQIEECIGMWPEIVDLHLCMNRITSIPSLPDPTTFSSLEVLNLDTNKLSGWADIKPFSNLPCLHTMILNSCNISTIEILEGEFANLNILYISGNKIAEWFSITQLFKCGKLQDLIFDANPILETVDSETSRQIVTAKLPQLKRYNRTLIVATERRGSELDYLKRFGEEWLTLGGSVEENETNKEFYTQHPTYPLFIKKYGAPEAGEVKRAESEFTSLSKNLISVNLTNGETSFKRNIPKTITVMKLRTVAQKLFKSKCKGTLQYLAKENGQIYDFDHDLREVDFYAVSNGDDIVFTPECRSGSCKPCSKTTERVLTQHIRVRSHVKGIGDPLASCDL